MSDYEEHFAPDEVPEMPTKRFAQPSSGSEAIVKKLIVENLKKVKESIKKDESEQARYLSLDNASKDIEIQELKEQLEKVQQIFKTIENFEKSLNLIQQNKNIYTNLYKNMELKNYQELMNMEMEQITINKIPEVLPEHEDILPIVITSLKEKYNSERQEEMTIRNQFHTQLLWSAYASRRRMYSICESIAAITIITIIIKYFM